VLSLSWFFIADSVEETLVKTLSFSALWPVLIGSLLSWVAWQWRGKAKNMLFRIPPGDVLSGVSWLWSHCLQMIRPLNAWGARMRQGTQWRQKTRQRLLLQFSKLLNLEGRLSLWTNAGALFLALLTVAFSLLVFRSQ
jgi:hypothetical protein